ncbi:MAG: glycosyltransferase family 9 protein [Ktedonobacteraceae bacterium]
MKSILVLRPGAIGDALLAFPVLKALREQYDGTRITLVSNAQVLPIAKAFGVAEQTFDFQDIQWSELFSTSGIRASSMRDLLSQTELAICWMRDPAGIIEHNLKSLGVKHPIIAPGRPSAGTDLHIVDYLARTIGLPDIGTKHITPIRCQPEENLSISVGARVDDVRLGGPLWSPVGGEYSSFIDEPTTSGDPLQTTIQAQDKVTKRFVAIHPGSGAAEKCWPISRFAEVIKRLWEQNYPVLLLSGPADTERVDDLLQQLPLSSPSEKFKLLTQAPLLEVAHQLLQCRCYLGNDSGITHLAAMLGVPTVAIFGPTDPKIWRPVGPLVKVIQGHTLEDVTVDEAIECLDF